MKVLVALALEGGTELGGGVGVIGSDKIVRIGSAIPGTLGAVEFVAVTTPLELAFCIGKGEAVRLKSGSGHEALASPCWVTRCSKFKRTETDSQAC